MSEPFDSELFTSSLLDRLMIMREMEASLARLQEREQEAKAKLLEAAPKNVSDFLVNDNVIDNLFRFGRSSHQVIFKKAYGFRGLEDLKEKLRALQRAWPKSLKIEFDPPEPHKVNVRFYALRR